MVRFYEIPFRNILRKIAEYQIREKKLKVQEPAYRDIIQQKIRKLDGPKFEKLVELFS